MAEQQLEDALAAARPSWKLRDVRAVQAKLSKVGICNNDDLASALIEEEGAELNNLLREAGEKAFSVDTLQQLVAYFVGDVGHADGSPQTDSNGNPAVTHAAPAPLDSSSTSPVSRLQHANKSISDDYLERQFKAQQTRAKPWKEVRPAGHTTATEQVGKPLSPARFGMAEEIASSVHKRPVTPNSVNEPTWLVAPPVTTEEVEDHDHSPKKAAVVSEKEKNVPSLDDILSQLEQEDLKEQEDLERLNELASQEGIDAEALESPDQLHVLVERLAELRKMTGSKLHSEYAKRGYAAFEGMSRTDVLPLVRKAIIAEALNLEGLQEACLAADILVDPDQPRSELLHMLQYDTWEKEGVPITRLPNLRVAQEVLNQVVDLENNSPDSLRARCHRKKLPALESTSRNALQRLLRKSIVWEHLPVPELQRECKALHLKVELAMGLTEMQIRSTLFQKLVASLRDDRLVIRGFPVDVLGQKRAEAVAVRLERMQVLGHLSLQSEWRKLGLPFDPKSDSQELVDRMKDVFIWQSMNIEAVRQKCVENGLDDSGRLPELMERLLIQQDCMRKWVGDRGLPIHRVPNFNLESPLARDLEYLEGMSKEDLVQRYTDMGYPEERLMERADLLKCLQTLLCWFAMPFEKLQEEAVSHNVKVEPHEDDQDRDALIDRLLQNERMQSWEARGYQARRLGKFNSVLQVVAQIELFVAMSETEVREAYDRSGLPLGDGSQDHLKILKDVIVWEALPLDDLQKEAKSKGIVPPDNEFEDDSHRRSFFIQVLIVESMKNSYLQRGLPVDQLGVVGAALLTKRFDSYESFDMQQVEEEFQHFGIAMPDGVEKQELVRFLQSMIIWISLSIDTLWRVCEDRGLILDGFDLQMPEPDLREQLLVRLLLQWRAKLHNFDEMNDQQSFEDVGAEFRACEHKIVWNYIETMRDPIMTERLCGIPSKPLPNDFLLPAAARSWKPLEAALFVLSAGKFNPHLDGRHAEESPMDETSGPLISVICPTSEHRQHFHPLLYSMFLRQAYEPKELVVVETGRTPSKFFVEKARDDPRIVYRHFDVEDAKINAHKANDQGNHQVAWSLGLKRNVACYLAKGDAIAQFDDDDLYAQNYLTFMWSKLLEAAPPREDPSAGLPPVAAKLTEWHLLDVASSNFGYMDAESDQTIPPIHRRGWLYGWGFCYIFSRSAWELCPYPDVEFAEDAGFYEALMIRSVPVALVRYPNELRATGLVAHSHHGRSTSGGSGAFADGLHGFDQSMSVPKQFLPMLPMVKRVHRMIDSDGTSVPARSQRSRFGESGQNGPLPSLKRSGVAPNDVVPAALKPGAAHQNKVKGKEALVEEAPAVKTNDVKPWQPKKRQTAAIDLPAASVA